jgi:hypothetical protein
MKHAYNEQSYCISLFETTLILDISNKNNSVYRIYAFLFSLASVFTFNMRFLSIVKVYSTVLLTLKLSTALKPKSLKNDTLSLTMKMHMVLKVSK